jgi:hypothetical protein
MHSAALWESAASQVTTVGSSKTILFVSVYRGHGFAHNGELPSPRCSVRVGDLGRGPRSQVHCAGDLRITFLELAWPPQRTITVETVELCFHLQNVAVLAHDTSAVSPSTSCSRKIPMICAAPNLLHRPSSRVTDATQKRAGALEAPASHG